MKHTEPVNGKFALVELPYAQNALEPVISSNTLSFHYGKHLQTYVDNLNAALPGSPWEGKTLEDIVCNSDGGVFNNAGQILNHNLYFLQFAPAREGNRPTGPLAEAIEAQFGSFEEFQAQFEKAGTTLFGSGWVWLSQDADGTLHITQEKNATNPILQGRTPLLTFDVWEHAYYLDYQNRRAAYLHALWPLVNWDAVEERTK